MNYPFWQLDFAGGGLLIALIAVFHVYIAHFAIGGGLFLVITELKARRENSPAILEYVRQHARFFLLLTVVMGALSGIGIWFTISVLNPAATSKLIHLFVFAWGIEWLFFIGEIIAIFIYYYTFTSLSPRNHLIIGWIYFGCAWLSLFFINGIVAFMLTPGEWLVTGSFWDAFFNPTFWPALFFRTFLALITAGLFGFVTAAALKEEELRLKLIRYSAKWLLCPFLLYLASAWWYRAALSPELNELIFQQMPEASDYLDGFLVLLPLLLLGGIIMVFRQPARLTKGLAGVMLVIGLLNLGAFEFLRESGRKPYIIPGYMYANSIQIGDLAEIAARGVLQSARWATPTAKAGGNQAATGKEIFNLLCLPCHSVGGPLNDIEKHLAGQGPKQLEKIINEMGWARPYMPPFISTTPELAALLSYLISLQSPDNRRIN
ncbi:MAG: cytochrome C [Desulfobulbaceae bacterium]|nr:cytochrome C [Desulfobulbaceae bacterium]